DTRRTKVSLRTRKCGEDLMHEFAEDLISHSGNGVLLEDRRARTRNPEKRQRSRHQNQRTRSIATDTQNRVRFCAQDDRGGFHKTKRKLKKRFNFPGERDSIQRTQIEKAQRVSRARDQALFDPTSSAYEQDLCLGSVFSFPCVGYGNSSQNMPAGP